MRDCRVFSIGAGESTNIEFDHPEIYPRKKLTVATGISEGYSETVTVKCSNGYHTVDSEEFTVH